MNINLHLHLNLNHDHHVIRGRPVGPKHPNDSQYRYRPSKVLQNTYRVLVLHQVPNVLLVAIQVDLTQPEKKIQKIQKIQTLNVNVVNVEKVCLVYFKPVLKCPTGLFLDLYNKTL